MPTAASIRREFLAFLARVAAGPVSVEDWNQFALAHYADADLERARRLLVREALLAGQCSAQPVQGDLGVVAAKLREDLGSS